MTTRIKLSQRTVFFLNANKFEELVEEHLLGTSELFNTGDVARAASGDEEIEMEMGRFYANVSASMVAADELEQVLASLRRGDELALLPPSCGGLVGESSEFLAVVNLLAGLMVKNVLPEGAYVIQAEL